MAQQNFSNRFVQFADELGNKLRSDLMLSDESALEKYRHDSWPLSGLRELKGDSGTAPRAALLPQTAEEVAEILRIANTHGIHLVIFGAGSNVTGAANPQSEECVILDMAKMNRIEVQPNDLTVTVQSGVMLKDLEAQLNGAGYTLRHFPQSFNLASIGGLIATNSIGQYSTKYGGIENMVLNLEVVLPDGTTAWLRNGVTTPRSSMGPELKFLVEGSEGMFGVVTKAVLRILPVPENTWMRAFRFSNFEEEGLHALKELMLADLTPSVARLYDGAESEIRFQTKESTLILLYEHRSKKVLDSITGEVLSKLGELEAKDVGEEPAKEWLETRFEVQREIELVKAIGAWFDTIEVATTWSNLPQLYRSFKKELGGVTGVMGVLAHASHIYTSGACIYFSVIFAQDEKVYWKIWDAAARVCRDNHATLSHHHGVGLLKKKYAGEELGEVSHEILSELKRSLDKNGILNSELWLQ